jgi:hypothetical protein
MALDRPELTEVARKYYDAELARRELMHPKESARLAGPDNPAAGENWLDGAACVCSYKWRPGQPPSADADNARAALQAAGIPCQIVVNEIQPPQEDPQPYHEYAVMVPGTLNLQANGALDLEIFNPGREAEWKTHLEALSDEEFRALDPDVSCAALRDLIERMTKAYEDEAERRRGKLR